MHTLVDAYGTPDHTDTDALANKLLWLQEKSQIRRTISAVSRTSLLTKKGNEEYGWEGHTVKVMLPSLLFLTAYCRTSVSAAQHWIMYIKHVWNLQFGISLISSIRCSTIILSTSNTQGMFGQRVVCDQATDWAVPSPDHRGGKMELRISSISSSVWPA